MCRAQDPRIEIPARLSAVPSMTSYWVVTNRPARAEALEWTSADAVDMILGDYDEGAPRWSFNPSPSRNPPKGFAKVRDGDQLLLYNGFDSKHDSRAFLAYAAVKRTAQVDGEFRILLQLPLGRLRPVEMRQLWTSRNAQVIAAEFQGLFRGYTHGPLDNLAAYPGPSSRHPARGRLRWRVILDVGTGSLTP